MILNDLIGKEVSGIGFIRDYVELYFDGPILRYLEDPVIYIKDLCISSQNSDWRNSLCLFIGMTVSNVAFVSEKQIEITFNDKKRLVVFRSENPRWGEMLHYLPNIGSPITIW